jgi:hypothetical protein
MKAIALAGLLALLATAAPAQSLDPVFTTGWTWNVERLSPGVTSLGGVAVTAARGSDAVFSSPAALTFGGSLGVDLTLAAAAGAGFVSHGERWHLAVGIRRTFSRAGESEGFDASRGTFDVGHVAFTMNEGSLGLATVAGRLRLGGALSFGKLGVKGAWQRLDGGNDAAGRPLEESRYVYGTQGHLRSWQVGVAASAIYDVIGSHEMAPRQARVGVAVRLPALGAFVAPRYQRSLAVLQGSSTASAFLAQEPRAQTFRLPPSVAVGAEISQSFGGWGARVVAGADWSGYGSVMQTARANLEATGDESPLAFDNTGNWDMGAGVELAFRTLKVRSGFRWERPHQLVRSSAEAEARSIGAPAFGLSYSAVFAGRILRFDLDSVRALETVLVTFGVQW